VVVVADRGVGGKVHAGKFVLARTQEGGQAVPVLPPFGPLRRAAVTDAPSSDPGASRFRYQAWRRHFRCGRLLAVKVRSKARAEFRAALPALTGFGTQYLVRGLTGVRGIGVPTLPEPD
jgi:hypothetical protein